MPRNGNCQLCGSHGPLIKAHIIPNSLYGPLFDQAGYALLETNVKGQFASKRSTGIYDNGIVCGQCERLFSPWDSYAATFLRDRDWSSAVAIGFGSRVEAIMTAEFDYPRLKLFFNSLLWRAAVSSQSFFSRVNLDINEESALRAMLLAGDSGTPDQFSVLLGKFDGPPPEVPELDPRLCWLDPDATQMNGHSWIRFYVLDWIAYIKTDRASLSESFRGTALRPDSPLCIIQRNFARSKELRQMWKMANGVSGDDEVEWLDH